MFPLGCNSLELSMTGIFLPCAQIGVDSLCCSVPGGNRKDADVTSLFLSCLWFPWGLVWVHSSSELSQCYRCCSICPAQTAKCIFLSSSDLSSRNHLPQCSVERWQCQLSHSALSRFLSLVPAGPHLLPFVKPHVNTPWWISIRN